MQILGPHLRLIESETLQYRCVLTSPSDDSTGLSSLKTTGLEEVMMFPKKAMETWLEAQLGRSWLNIEEAESCRWQCQVCWFWRHNLWLNPGLYFTSHCLKQLSFPDLKKKNCYTDDMGFPGDVSGKESACQYRRLRDTSSILGLGRSPGGRHGNLLHYSCLENPMDRGAWRALICRVTKSWPRLKQLSRHSHIQIRNIWDLFPVKLCS